MGNFGIEALLGAIKVFEYFADSNFAGKVVIFVFVLLNCTAIALMWTKFQEIKRALRNNARDESELIILLRFSITITPCLPVRAAPISESAHGQWMQLIEGKKEGEVRMNYVENAIKRALSEVGDRYEAKMYWLATIVSGAPFLGLLGTVWGVMDAFGTMDAGGATIEHLAPGVSGALLTTVAALCVAIPIVFVYNGLLGMTRGAMTKLENFASNLADRIELEMDS